MKIRPISYLLLLGTIILSACSPNNKEITIDEEYIQRFEKITSNGIKFKHRYVQLIALQPLMSMSDNSFGTDSTNTHQIMYEKLPSRVGSYSLLGESLIFIAHPGLEITDEDGKRIDTLQMEFNERNRTPLLRYQSFRWWINKFGPNMYLRIADDENPKVADFKSAERYDLTNEFIFNADVEYYDKPNVVAVSNILNVSSSVNYVGKISFSYNEEQFELEFEKGGFVMFSDRTAGVSTYGPGRYVYFRDPDKTGKAILDFNYAFNPPCSYSEFTTCQFAPKQNVLPFEVTAGEKYQSDK